jgi:hypothetical protein
VNELFRHAREFKRYLTNHQFERMPDGGVLFPRAAAIARGVYVHGVNGRDWQEDANLLPDEGLNHMLDVTLNSGTQITTWYFALYSGAVSPAANWNAAGFAATATEITSSNPGYSETTRQLWVGANASSDSTNNLSNKAVFTIAVSSGTLTVNGCGMLSASTKGSTSGKLVSASRFGATRTLSDGDLFNLGYTLTLSSS